MKTPSLVVTLLILAAAPLLSQTRLIAHRSHSGSIESFTAEGEDNFGMPPRMIDSVLRISDTFAIEFTSEGIDTTFDHPDWNNPNVGLDSLRKLYPWIKFIELENKWRHSDLVPGSERTSAHAFMAGEQNRSGGALPLVLLAAALAPAIAWGTWRAERRRRA